MKNFSSLITENEQTKKYKYNATVKVEGIVTAMSEGDAGELADKELDTIPGIISGEIDNIEAIGSEVKEDFAAGEITEDDKVEFAFQDIITLYGNKCATFDSEYYIAMLTAKLKQYFEAL